MAGGASQRGSIRPAVVLVSPKGREVAVSSAKSFVQLVYGLDWRPKVGSVATNYSQVTGRPAGTLLRMAIRTTQVAVGTTAVELTGIDSSKYPGSSFAVKAPAAATLWVGPANVTPATGWPIEAGAKEAYDLAAGDKLYGILAAGTGTAYVFQSGI